MHRPIQSRGRVVALLLVVGASVLAATAGAEPRTASASCRSVGRIAEAGAPLAKAYLQLGCKCPRKSCVRLSKNQQLFENETMFSGAGTITFNSAVTGVPSLTCYVSPNSKNVIYPSLTVQPGARAVLDIRSGATSCRVEQGARQTGKRGAVFVVNHMQLVIPGDSDPVFGIKAAGNGSLIQVKKGTVKVGTAIVGAEQQKILSDAAVTSLQPDAALQPGLCLLTPELALTNVQAASGAHPGGVPLGLAPDRDGNLWFTDNQTPAIGLLDRSTGTITYPNNNVLRAGSKPTFIVADTRGRIWFTDAGTTPAIGMINPRTKTIVLHNAPAGSEPWNPMYDPVHDLVWFTDRRRPTGAIGVFDPKTSSMTEYSKGLNEGSHPEGLVVGKKGNVWFTDDSGTSPAIGMLEVSTHTIREYSDGLVKNSLPRGITIDPSGNIWFADERGVTGTGDSLIGKLSTTDPKHRIVEYAVHANGGNTDSVPEGLTFYRGFVWFTDDGATKAIGRIDTTTGAITESSNSLEANSQPIGIVVSKGVLWFTDRLGSSPKIGRLVAKTC